MKFRDLEIGQAFDFINPETGTANSFYEQCRKTGARKYEGLTNGRTYTVGSINALVFHVEQGAINKA